MLPVPVIGQLASNRRMVVVFAPVVFTTMVPLLLKLPPAIGSLLPGTRFSRAVLTDRLSAPI